MFNYIREFALSFIFVAFVSYLLGSLSFSIIFTKLFDNHVDIRSLGSGNAGATNVLRSVGVKAAVFTTIFDFGKGAASVIIGREVFRYYCSITSAPEIMSQYGAYIAGVACVIGHIFPVFFSFKGGKGVLTSAAMIALIDWRIFLFVIAVFIIVFIFSKIVSLSSICGAGSFPIATFLITFLLDYRGGEGSVPLSYVLITTAIALILAFTVITKHKSNIERIKNGTEKKITINHR